MQSRYSADHVRYRQLGSDELRKSYLVEGLFGSEVIALVYADADRAILGSAVPGKEPLILSTAEELKADYFTERRELGVLNIGGPGQVQVEGETYLMENLDCLYIGRGNRQVSFSSIEPRNPSAYYLLSYPAHAAHPTTKVAKNEASVVSLGTEAECNRRLLYKCIHPHGIPSCQLVMGFTELQTGSVWNTMPPHTHTRRSEVYLYFNIPESHRVFHFMGEPQETRHVVVADRQAVISPSWSIHSGAGTSNYTFCWGMGGENQRFDDMDPAPVAALR